MATNDGGQVFPSPASVELKDFGRVEHEATRGLSLRDWFAGQALAGGCGFVAPENIAATTLAAEAYAIADAMLMFRGVQS